MPSKKSGSKGKGGKGSKNSKGKGSKGSPERLAEIEKTIFGRERYDAMDSIFIRKSKNIVLFAPKIHIYEVWNRLPPVQKPKQEEPPGGGGGKSTSSPKGSKKSPKKGKSPKKSKSPKNSPGKGSSAKTGEGAPEEPQSEYERALLIGSVAVPKTLLKPGDKLFVEVTADFVYYDYSKVPPFPPAVVSNVRCYRDFYYIFPYNFDRPTPFTVFAQHMLIKVHDEYPHGWYSYAFLFDLTRKPDSIFFTRPYHVENISGLKWTLRAFAARTEYCIPPPENEVSMTFYKYTIAPVLFPSVERPISTVNYTRYACLQDTGSLAITAQLDRDVYYQGDTVNITVSISNDSSRHIVSAITVCIEQNCRLVSEIPHTYSIRIGEIYIGPGEFGLPVNPKNKGWSKEFNIRPMYDRSLRNLVVDGRMVRDHKIFLAESTVIMRADIVKLEPPPEPPASGSKSPKKGSKGSPKGASKGKGGSKGSKGKGSKGKGSKGKGSPKEKTPPAVPPEPSPPPPILEKEVNVLVDNQVCRTAIISYEAVVRCTIRTPAGDEGGAPSVRVPFLLSRNSRYFDKLNVQTPPIFATAVMH
ncbi:hypothetical protein AAHC03_012900 [Spirometra sp. Aus1]